MPSNERFGPFVVHAPDTAGGALVFERAAQFSNSGYERHVTLLRLAPMAPDVAERCVESLRNALVLQGNSIVRVLDVGRIEGRAFGAYEFFEGRSLGDLLRRSRDERQPFAADHALLVASRVAAAIEVAHAKKIAHGFLTPDAVVISHEGDVRVRGFGIPSARLRDARVIGPSESLYLAPEVAGGALADARSDVWSVSAQLYEMLTGDPVDKTRSASELMAEARLIEPSGDGAPLPSALLSLLTSGLEHDPTKRFKDTPTFRKAVDTVLFSGAYSPTTFNLAFFMHTLFGDESEAMARALRDEKAFDYGPYIAASKAATEKRPADATFVDLPPQPAARAADATLVDLRAAPKRDADSTLLDAPRVAPPTMSAGKTGPTKVAPPAPTLFEGAEAPAKSSFPIVPVAAALLLALGGAGYYFTLGPGGRSPSTVPAIPAPTMSLAEQTALAKVKELEAKLAQIEADRLAAEQKAADEAKKKIEAQAAAKGRTVDPAELQRAQDEARRKAQAEQDAKVEAERKRIEDEKRRADEERAKAEEAAKVAKAAETPKPPEAKPAESVKAADSAKPAETPAPTSAQGTPAPTQVAAAPSPISSPSGPVFLNLSDADVTAPQLLNNIPPVYPPIARSQRVGGTVVVSALIDEKGNVADARIIRGVAGSFGLNEAALASVKKRKYKPAMQKGVAGRAWIAIQVEFKT